MAIKNKRQESLTASPAPPTSLVYGEISISNDGKIYAGDKDNNPQSKASTADVATKATQDASGNTICCY